MKKYIFKIIFLLSIILVFGCSNTNKHIKLLNEEITYKPKSMLIYLDTLISLDEIIIKTLDSNENIIKIEKINKEINRDGKSKIVQIYNNGILQSELPYKNGIIDGTLRFFYDDGTICREANYVQGILNGSSIDFKEDGMIYRIANFKNGKLFGKYTIYKDNMEIEWQVYIYDTVITTEPLETLLIPKISDFYLDSISKNINDDELY